MQADSPGLREDGAVSHGGGPQSVSYDARDTSAQTIAASVATNRSRAPIRFWLIAPIHTAIDVRRRARVATLLRGRVRHG